MPSVFIFLTDGDVILRASPSYLGILRQMYTESNINKWKKQNPHSVSFPSNFIHFVHISILKNQLTISIIEKFLKLRQTKLHEKLQNQQNCTNTIYIYLRKVT